MLEFRILGPLEVSDEAGPIALGGQRQRALLAALLLDAAGSLPPNASSICSGAKARDGDDVAPELRRGCGGLGPDVLETRGSGIRPPRERGANRCAPLRDGCTTPAESGREAS